MTQTMLDVQNFSLIQSQSKLEQKSKEMEMFLNTFTERIENQQDQHFSQDDNVNQKKKEKNQIIIVTQKLKQEIC